MAIPTLPSSSFRALQAADPDQPLGYLLEDEARWWKNLLRARWN